MRDKRILEILKKQILNTKTVEKSFEDIRNLVICDNYEELLHILRCIENRGKMTPGTNKVSFNVVLNKDFKSRIDAHQEQNGGRVEGVEFPFDTPIQEEKDIAFGYKAEGIKETEGKLHYELSWEFIEEMAKRMANNKSDKYPLYNWKKSNVIKPICGCW